MFWEASAPDKGEGRETKCVCKQETNCHTYGKAVVLTVQDESEAVAYGYYYKHECCNREARNETSFQPKTVNDQSDSER
jgi:hypothetical protein